MYENSYIVYIKNCHNHCERAWDDLTIYILLMTTLMLYKASLPDPDIVWNHVRNLSTFTAISLRWGGEVCSGGIPVFSTKFVCLWIWRILFSLCQQNHIWRLTHISRRPHPMNSKYSSDTPWWWTIFYAYMFSLWLSKSVPDHFFRW